MNAAISAAGWVVGKALSPVSDGLLENWAATKELGHNTVALKMELLYAQGMLDNAQGRDVRSHALKELLHKLRQLAYAADDVLDELDYYHIQDKLDGTYHAANVHAGGCIHDLVLNARHTARAVASKLKLSSCSRDANPDHEEDDAKQGCLSIIRSCGGHEISSSQTPPTNQGIQEVHGDAVGKLFRCCNFQSVNGMLKSSKAPQKDRTVQTPKLMFVRVELSKRMMDIVQQLKPICSKVYNILNLELSGSSRNPTQDIAATRPKTTPGIIEQKFFGREEHKKDIIDGIKHGNKYYADVPTVLPIVGPGGIGKTTFTRHIYQELKSSFQVTIWICVSLSFNANSLAQEIVKKTPKVDGEKEHSSDEELIEQRLKDKRFLLVLDDVWTYHNEDEWKKLLAPFRKGKARGNMVIVTTRIPEVATMVKTVDCSIELNGLAPEDFMHLFEAYVFGGQQSLEDHPELVDVGNKIVGKLKGFPLAAKTVGRLLRDHLTLDHWTSVLENKEWESQSSDYDIMPALKLSYDYLPFHLQQCFFYGALFPEDYEFGSKELVHLWIGLDILDSSSQGKRLEDVGLCYLNDLVNRGFFKKNEKEDGSARYVMHDLMHELAVKVSSSECLSISRSNVRSVQSRLSVRHLSIIIDDNDVNDRVTFEDFKRDLSTLDDKLEVGNLQTVMLFGKYHGSFAKMFGDLFVEAKALRVILLSKASGSYIVEDVFRGLPRSVHLRYLRITTTDTARLILRSNISRFYHLRVLDFEQCKDRVQLGFPSEMSNLAKLSHFLVWDCELHSNIFEVGKMKFLQELRSFMVNKEKKGFELRQIAQMVELGGSLSIRNIENVERKEEANEAKLVQKRRLEKLILEWGVDRHHRDLAEEQHVLESLKPHSNLLHLHIGGHLGATCPSWLGEKLSVKRLESLCLVDVAWNKFPPLGELWFVNEEHPSGIPSQNFQNLKRLELVKISRLGRWVRNGTCQLFSQLEGLIIRDCSELVELPFSGCQSETEANMTCFPRLRDLKIIGCPKLSALPPVPWSPSPCSAKIERAGSGFERLSYSKTYKSELRLEVEGKVGGPDSMFWNVLVFSNLADLKELVMNNCPPLPLDHLKKLTSLKFLEIMSSSNVLLPIDVESHVIYQLPVDTLRILDSGASGKELTRLLACFPYLSELTVAGCGKITRVGVVETTRAASSSANEMEQVDIGQQQAREEEEIATAAEGEGLVLLPPQLQLQELEFRNCPELTLLSCSLNDPTALQGLRSLRELRIRGCPKFLSSYSSSPSSCFPFPASLQQLVLWDLEGMETLDSLSNLTSLTELDIGFCGDLRGEGIWPLLARGSLTKLWIELTPKFFEPPRTHDKELFSCRSCKLEVLRTDDPTGFLAAPICSLLSSSLTRLDFWFNLEVERFSKEQEDALQLLNSLQELEFRWFDKLQCLPAGLHGLDRLKRLQIYECPALKSLPKDGLPDSLQKLEISDCPAFKSLPKGSLPDSLQNLRISCCPALKSLPKGSLPDSLQQLTICECPALKSLPKDGLPDSLQELDVQRSNNEELSRHCRKFKGTIPIIRD